MSDSDSELESKEIEWERRVTEMREHVKARLDVNTIDGNREESLYHGMKLVSSAVMLGNLKEICYCEETGEYLIIQPSNMLRYSVEGKLIQPSYPLTPTMIFSKLLWCQRAKVLIGYQTNDDMIWLMTSVCMIYQVVRNDFRISSIFYEPETNEAVVAGSNKVTRFLLTNKESTVNPWKTMSYIDSEYGALWKLEYMSLVPSSTSKLRIAGSYMTTIYVLPLETSKEKEEAVPIMFLARNPGATAAPITALLFQLLSQWIIAGDEQGNVTGWDLELNCMMNCRGGHSRCVRLIVSHPSICGFVTSGEDNVLQIWSCNLRGKMESFSDMGEISGIAVNESAAAIATLGQKLACFHMHQLYTFYAALSDSATQIISTMNPMYSIRVVVRSADNTIRILTSPSGKQTNLQILPRNLDLVSMAYSGNRERLYTIILKTGEVLVSNTKTNPMELKHVWIPRGTVITCITAYEYYEEIRGPDRKPQKPRVIYPKYTLIFVGTADGAVMSINEASGKHENRLAAHKGPVTKLWSSTISKLVVSVGVDKCVKVWKVFADLASPLALTYSIYYTVPITQIVTMGSVLCMASSAPGTLLHQLFMYDMVERDHHQSEDHTKLIVDIAASESLQTCATSSMDNTIRIWDEQNIPIKVLEINTCANNIVFSSLRGDIVFGAGRHLYRISYKNYLAPKYRARILMNEIGEETEEESMPENKEYRIYDEVVDRAQLLHPVSSAPLGSLDVSNGDAPRLELMIQQQKCALLERRDQDIDNIRKGEIHAVQFVANKSLMTHDAWEKYIQDIVGTDKSGGEVQPQDIWAMVEKFKNVKRFYNKPGVFRMLYGYSIERFPEYPDGVPDSVQHPGLPLFAFLPNSVIYKLFSVEDMEPPSPVPEKPLVKYKYPSEFLMEQLHQSDDQIHFDSRVEITASQLMNMTRISKDDESETNLLRVSIPEEYSLFRRMARVADKRERKSNSKERKARRGGLKELNRLDEGIRRKSNRIARKNKIVDPGISSTMEKIIYGEQGKPDSMISSQKIADRRNPDKISWTGQGFQTYPCVSRITLHRDRVSPRNQEPKVRKRKVLVKRSPKSWKLKKMGGKKSGDQGQTCQLFENIDDLARMSVEKVIAQKKSIEQILKNDYGSISAAHDEKIKTALTGLLARCVNSPSSFSSILRLLEVLPPAGDIEIVGFLCAIFSVTLKKIIRKSVMKYLKNHGLRDPKRVLTQQLLVVRHLTDTSDVFATEKFISRMIADWMETLEEDVALVSQAARNTDGLKTRERSLLQEADLSSVKVEDFLQRREPVVSPIEGLNYFCELNAKFLRKKTKALQTRNSSDILMK